MSAALYEYIAALWQHWTWFVTGGPFLAGRIAKNMPGYESWVSKWLSPKLRFRLTVGAWIVGIFIASFLAFDDKREKLLSLQTSLKNVVDEANYEPIAAWQLATLKSELALVDRPRVAIGFAGNWSTSLVASQLGKALDIQPRQGYIDGPGQFGIRLDVADPDNISKKIQMYIDAFNKSKIDFTIVRENKENIPDYDLIIYVAPRSP